MSRYIGETVTTNESGGLPRGFTWRRRFYRVNELLDQWREAGGWWSQQPERRHFRVIAASATTGSGIYELCRVSNNWLLNRVLD